MLKKFLLMSALAGAVGLAATYWPRPVTVPHPLPASVSGPASPGGKNLAAVPLRFHPLPQADELPAQLAQEIQRQLNSGDEVARERVLTNLLPELAGLNPAAAGRLAEATPPDAGRNDVLRGVAQAWAGQDPAGALAWAAQLPDTDEQRMTLANVVFQMAQSDPAKAVDAAQQYDLNEGLYDVLPSLAVQWADKDLAAALAWAGNQPAGEQRDQLMARIAFVESQNAPAEAGARVLSEIPPGTVQDEAVLTVLHQWSLKDMAGALAWVQRFPEIPLKERALAELAVVGARQN